MGKVLTGKLACMQTGLVQHYSKTNLCSLIFVMSSSYFKYVDLKIKKKKSFQCDGQGAVRHAILYMDRSCSRRKSGNKRPQISQVEDR